MLEPSRAAAADTSPAAGSDVSQPGWRDASHEDPRDGSRCVWCNDPMPAYSASGRRRRADSVTCSKRCRQARHRWRIEQSTLARAREPMSFGYADPPYPGRSKLYPEATEVDHGALIARLMDEFPDGWALSTASDALHAVLPLCPADVRVCAWSRPARYTSSRRPLSAWEPLIVWRGREWPTQEVQTRLDTLHDLTRFRGFPGAMVGMKTPSFAVWLFEQLGARPGDELVDLFPGSGAIGYAWRAYCGEPELPAAQLTATTSFNAGKQGGIAS